MGLCINKRGRGQRRGQLGWHLFQPQAASLVTLNDSTSPHYGATVCLPGSVG